MEVAYTQRRVQAKGATHRRDYTSKGRDYTPKELHTEWAAHRRDYTLKAKGQNSTYGRIDTRGTTQYKLHTEGTIVCTQKGLHTDFCILLLNMEKGIDSRSSTSASTVIE